MRALVFTPDRDAKPGDYSGAFAVEAPRLLETLQLSSADWVQVDIRPSFEGRRQQVLAALQRAKADGPLDLVAFICHGWHDGLQLGFSLGQTSLLAAGIAGCSTSDVAVVLYACSTAEDNASRSGTAQTQDGFAVQLQRDLGGCVGADRKRMERCHVDAHTCAGHTTSNPYVRRIAAQGGGLIVGPSSPRWEAWKNALADRHHNTLRFRFPRMTIAEIEAELQPH